MFNRCIDDCIDIYKHSIYTIYIIYTEINIYYHYKKMQNNKYKKK